MARLQQIAPEAATGKTKDLYDGLKAKMGGVPNLTRVMANSPAALEGYVGLSGALAGGSLPSKVRQQLALAVGQYNGCGYCLAAHTAIGKNVGLTPEQMAGARHGTADDAKVDALIKFARKVVDARGKVDASDVEAVKAAGWDDGAVAETVAHIALNVYTNYLNIVADTDLDFPAAPAV